MDKLSAPVGNTARKGEGDPVKNKPADIDLVRKMLRANKYNVPETGGADAGLVKAINAAQMKLGFKKPDGVIDPDGKVFKALLAKYLIAKKEAEKVKMYQVRYRGKDYLLTEPDLKKMKLEVFDRLERYIKALISSHKTNMSTYEEYLNTAMLKDGYMNAVTQAIIMRVGSVKFPKSSLATKSIAAVGALERSVMSKNLAALDTALPEAEAAVNAFSADVMRFLREFTGSAQTTATVLQVTSAVSFAVVGALAAPVLVTGLGMSAAAAAVTSGAGVAVLSSASGELGKHASGQNVSLWDSVKSVAIDGTIGALTAGIGNKIPLGFVDKMAKGLAPKLAGKVPGITASQLQPYIQNFLTGTGQETIKSAVGEAVGLLGKMAKSGKRPTEKDFDEAVQKVLMTAMTAGLMKNLGTFQKKWAYDAKETLQGKIMPDVLKGLMKKNELPNVIKAKVYAEVWNKVSEEVTKAGLTAVMEDDKAQVDPPKMSALAAKQVANDAKIKKLVEAETLKALKKYKVDVK